MSIWDELQAHRKASRATTLADRLRDPARFDNFSLRLGDMVLDFSKTSIDAHACDLLVRLAETSSRPVVAAGIVLTATRLSCSGQTRRRGRAKLPGGVKLSR